MRECKVIHIQDGNPRVLKNENFHFIEEYEWMAEALGDYLNDGYKVVHMIPDFSPTVQQEGAYTFYKSGIVVYLEKDI